MTLRAEILYDTFLGIFTWYMSIWAVKSKKLIFWATLGGGQVWHLGNLSLLFYTSLRFKVELEWLEVSQLNSWPTPDTSRLRKKIVHLLRMKGNVFLWYELLTPVTSITSHRKQLHFAVKYMEKILIQGLQCKRDFWDAFKNTKIKWRQAGEKLKKNKTFNPMEKKEYSLMLNIINYTVIIVIW